MNGPKSSVSLSGRWLYLLLVGFLCILLFPLHFPTVSTYVDTVGRNKEEIKEHIKHQFKENNMSDMDPFTGNKNK